MAVSHVRRADVRRAIWATSLTIFAVACGKSGESNQQESAVPSTISASPNAPVESAANIPAGYEVQLDRSDAIIDSILYAADGTGRWDVHTGPAHILYALKDTAANKYRVTTTIDQLELPKHPEAYGVFIGGANLKDSANATYTYFLVRGDGKYTVKVRDSAGVRTLTDWTQHRSIPVANGTGPATYGITIDVDGDKADVSVNGQPITSIDGKTAPLNGITGVRINHNLHVMVTPIAITR